MGFRDLWGKICTARAYFLCLTFCVYLKWRKGKCLFYNLSYVVILHLSTSSLMGAKLNHFSNILSNAWHLLHEKIGSNRHPWCSMIQRRPQTILSENPAKYGWLATLAPWYYIDRFISRISEKKFCLTVTKFITKKKKKVLDYTEY